MVDTSTKQLHSYLLQHQHLVLCIAQLLAEVLQLSLLLLTLSRLLLQHLIKTRRHLAAGNAAAAARYQRIGRGFTGLVLGQVERTAMGCPGNSWQRLGEEALAGGFQGWIEKKGSQESKLQHTYNHGIVVRGDSRQHVLSNDSSTCTT